MRQLSRRSSSHSALGARSMSAISLDEDDGVVILVSGDLSEDTSSQYHDAYKFIRSFRKFAKNRLLNFDVQNIGKSNLDKRDYMFQAKPKEISKETPMMESKMFGTNRISYQDLGEARLVVKHNQPINPEISGARSMHIEHIYVENADGERFKYPLKHLSGARALAEHIKTVISHKNFSEKLVQSYTSQLNLFDPGEMNRNIKNVYSNAGF